MNATNDIWAVGNEVEIFRIENGQEIAIKTETIVARTARRFSVRGYKFIPESGGSPVAQQVCNSNPVYARPVAKTWEPSKTYNHFAAITIALSSKS